MLRHRGQQAEHDMFQATNGINTHKGAIFSMGLLSAGATLSYIKNESFNIDSICHQANLLVQDIFTIDFHSEKKTETTQGLRLYDNYRITGIRGEAKSGFPTIVYHAYPYFKSGLKKGYGINGAGALTLIKIINHCEDTNLIARGGLDGLKFAQSLASEFLKNSSESIAIAIHKIHQMDQVFIQKNLSPGGSADLLACTLFLHFLANHPENP